MSPFLQEKDLVNRYAEATAENTQRQKQMNLAKNLILQVREPENKNNIWPLHYHKMFTVKLMKAMS